jgi:hypothetical protein
VQVKNKLHPIVINYNDSKKLSFLVLSMLMRKWAIIDIFLLPLYLLHDKKHKFAKPQKILISAIKPHPLV